MAAGVRFTNHAQLTICLGRIGGEGWIRVTLAPPIRSSTTFSAGLNSPEKASIPGVFSALAVPHTQWNDAFAYLKMWRTHLRETHDIGRDGEANQSRQTSSSTTNGGCLVQTGSGQHQRPYLAAVSGDQRSTGARDTHLASLLETKCKVHAASNTAKGGVLWSKEPDIH
jgi:hypothetical protein